jgi:hypothetical protein
LIAILIENISVNVRIKTNKLAEDVNLKKRHQRIDPAEQMT